ncbi:myb/SANT-like DNA-binding domain-containing protein 7 [Anolis sagrei]|uniref:myb/SANT-like DNA-binding domain-containing protein 7 n=1 Tax=Anolis sagrei TaxID=38937 RepID=UPI003521E040
MQNNYSAVTLLGLGVEEPELICKIEPEEERWNANEQAARERQILPGSKSAAATETPEATIAPYRQYRGTTWTYPEVIDLLVIWREREIQQELLRSHRNLETFQAVANKMAKKGHKRSALECRSKIKTLRRDYRIAKANNSPGKGHLAWLFYDRLDHLLENDTDIPPPEKLAGLSQHRVSMADSTSQCSTEEEVVAVGDGTKRGSPGDQEVVVLGMDSPGETSGMGDGYPGRCIKEEAPDEMPVTLPMEVNSPVLLLPSVPCDKPSSSASTPDGAVSPSPSPIPPPARSFAAERLDNIRKRKRRNRQDMALEITQAADRRVEMATDRILTALGEYAKADLEDRERDRMDTEQIIALMNRQTELLESLVRKQTEARIPRLAQPNHPADPLPLRLGIARRHAAKAKLSR